MVFSRVSISLPSLFFFSLFFVFFWLERCLRLPHLLERGAKANECCEGASGPTTVIAEVEAPSAPELLPGFEPYITVLG